MIRYQLLFLCLISYPVFSAATPWKFAERISVSGAETAALYHHLEGSGRKHIAVAGETVGVVWEDNRSGDPQIYASIKKPGESAFAPALAVSTGSEAYEPAIVAIQDQQFALAWEQDSTIVIASMAAGTLGQALKLSASTASHVSLATHDGKVFAIWREHSEQQWSLNVSVLTLAKSGQWERLSTSTVEQIKLDKPILYPTIASNAAGICVAWEDRRNGHTRLLYSFSKQGTMFSPVENLNEFFSNRNQYDKGNGVTRVVLSTFSDDEIVASWMDKRRSAGYGIFAALGDTESQFFGPNEKVHGDKGDTLPHYNPAVDGNTSGDFIIAWDDYRNGDSDIWISNFDEDRDSWSDDYSPRQASGAMEQTHPSISLDDHGRLHLIWIERENLNGVSQIWYSLGEKGED